MKRQGQRQKKYKGNDKDKGSRYDVGFRQIDRGALCNRRLSSEYWRSNHWFLMDWKDINEPTKLYVPWNIWLDFFFFSGCWYSQSGKTGLWLLWVWCGVWAGECSVNIFTYELFTFTDKGSPQNWFLEVFGILSQPGRPPPPPSKKKEVFLHFRLF